MSLNVSAEFHAAIKLHLDERAKNDPQFAERYNLPNKKLDDCCTYILNWVHKSGCNGFSDAEIFGQAIHYYDEDNIDVGKPISCKVVTNCATDQPKPSEAPKAAKKPFVKKKEEQANNLQQTLF